MDRQTGLFITFEGGEGAGKSTQLKMLAHALNAVGCKVVSTREPGGTAGAEAIRSLVVDGAAERWDPLCELLLMMAARCDHVERLIRPALAENNAVLCDRFFDSSRVYQGLAGGLGLDLVDRYHEPLLAGLRPNLTILIDLDPVVGLERRRRTVESGRFEAKGLAFHQEVRAGFLELAWQEPKRFLIINGHQSLDDVSKAILEGISERLGIGLVDA